MRYFFRVEYRGTAYHGWQRQRNGTSIQECLEQALSTVCRHHCEVVGGGRTDAGVHARRQGAHVDIDGAIDPGAVQCSVNAVLPPDIAIHALQQAPDDFHARYSATERRYRYRMHDRKSPLRDETAWVQHYAVDWERVAREASSLVGTHDFTTFCASGSGSQTAVCTVRISELVHIENQWVFFITANRFVYKMVRSLVGTLVDIGRGACSDSMAELLRCQDRSRAGPTAPACGLTLEDVIYPGVVE